MVIIEFKKEDINFAKKIIEVSDISTGIVEKKSFNGVSELIQIGVVLTPAIITGISKIITEMVKNKRVIHIKIDNKEVDGITEKNVLSVLQLLLEKEQSKKHNKK